MEQLRKYICESKNIICVYVNQSLKILEYNNAFKTAFDLRTDAATQEITKFYADMNKAHLSRMESFSTKVEGALLFDHLTVEIVKVDEKFLLLSELKHLMGNDVLNEMASLNQELINMTRALDRKNKELDKALIDIKRSQAIIIQKEHMAGLGRMAAGMAHEINNPLGIIMSDYSFLWEYVDTSSKLVAHLIKQKDIPIDLTPYEPENLSFTIDELPDIHEEMSSAMNRIRDIVSSFREYTGVDITGERYDYDINRGVDLALNLLKGDLEMDIRVEKNLEQGIPFIPEGQPMNAVLTHLIRNAVQAVMDKESSGERFLHIQTFYVDKQVHLTIEDNGIGMDSDILERCMQPFFTTRDVGSGQGLGLTICYETITNTFNGEMRINSSPNSGTKVEVSIPSGRS